MKMDGDLDSVGSNKDNSPKGRPPETYSCRFCNRKFSKLQALGCHMRSHRDEIKNEEHEIAKALAEQKRASSSWMMNNQHLAAQIYASIPGGVQTHVELFSPSQVQTWAQAGCSSSLSTYSDQNVGGGISGVGPSLPTSCLNQQQQDHINYQMRERYPSHPNHQMRETYPSLPYQMNNNPEIGGGASLVNNSGISGPSLPMNNQLQIRGPSSPILQGGNPNLVVSGQNHHLSNNSFSVCILLSKPFITPGLINHHHQQQHHLQPKP
ncbi:hypothetical protein SUGI_1184580 [Cryptomeria japonica]|uniref:uncharacterized protein LOC131860350 n=1 Tax=Cryptomeria japonica TaxID=3369 RepID=UPI00241472A4|nr:uncharacterized protein LOC131860350 [Cryptomeria japonica]GLJ55205.1 hypothetical protein SUGI_1184580 [Cryptomeria japonica]